MRLGEIDPEPIQLVPGDRFTLTSEDTVGNAERVSMTFEALPRVVKPGDRLFLNDGLVQLVVDRVSGNNVECIVTVGGELRSRKGLNLPGINLGISSFTKRDRECLEFALGAGVDAVSQSFVERADDIEEVRKAAAKLGHQPFIIAKIERADALAHYDEILAAADGIMVVTTNPFFVTMQTGAKAFAQKQGNINLTVASGKQEGDDQGQIDAIEASIAKGDKGILITPMSTGVNSAIKKARDAGLYVIALDTPPDPANTVDITFATDNFKAGKLIGQWAQVQMAGKPATIAMLDLFNDKVVSVDYNRDQGFLTGMGIPVGDPKKNGDEAKTGSYTGGTYTIVCNEAGNGAADGGRRRWRRCLTKNPDINLVYTINEPTAVGANAALKAAGKTATIVSIDGGCAASRR